MREILELLEEDGRMRPEEIAVRLGRDVDWVISTLRQLEEEKVILGYKALVNWDRIGGNGVTAIIDVKVTPEREVGFDKVAERIYRFPQVRSVYLMSGTYDLSVVIEGKTMKEVAFFVAEKLATLEFVQGTTTHFVLKKYKQDGVVFEESEKDFRLVVTP
ncbi:MAG: Lrp/AsnC family transcriptional regulator [Syntrophomonadaceae bacterium]|nr:Lrp/AsnC family transcriptional regulator [Syntrophomonadaceae bacterium]